MAYEIKPWKKPNCTISLKVSDFSNRETFSHEINKEFGEGGGLNADYQTLEAAAIVANFLGYQEMKYGTDFVFKTGGLGSIIFDFKDEATKSIARKYLAKSQFFKLFGRQA